MLVKFTRSLPGGEKRGFVEGREHDWPMQLITKFRQEWGTDVLVMAGTNADRMARHEARRERLEGAKPGRQERLRAAGMQVEVQAAVSMGPARAPGLEAELAQDPPARRRGPGRPRGQPRAYGPGGGPDTVAEAESAVMPDASVVASVAPA